MLEFRTFFKVIKKRSAPMIIYVAIFAAIAVFSALNSMQSTNKTAESSLNKHIKIAVINENNNDKTYSNLQKYLEGTFRSVNIKNDDNVIAESLLNGYVDYVLKIKEDGSLKYYILNNTEAFFSVSQKIQEYLKTYAFLEEFKCPTPKEKSSKILSDNIDLTFSHNQKSKEQIIYNGMKSYYRFWAYVFISILMMGVYAAQSRFNKSYIVQRINISAKNPIKVNLNIYLSSFIFILAVWLVFVIIAASLFGHRALLSTYYGPQFLITSAVFMIPAGALAYLVAVISKSDAMNNVLVNTLSIALAFISGVFIPMSLMPSFLEKVAVASPVYWYIMACNSITSYSFDLRTVLPYFVIQVLMAMAFLVIALLLLKNKKLKELN